MSEQIEDGMNNTTGPLKSVEKDILSCRKKGSIKEYFSAKNNEFKKRTTSKSIQVNLDKWISEIDLSLQVPSESYWKIIAENTRKALAETLTENEILYKELSQLKEQKSTFTDALNEVNSFIEVFQEIMSSSGDSETRQTQ